MISNAVILNFLSINIASPLVDITSPVIVIPAKKYAMRVTDLP